MNPIGITSHAAKRLQQRSIPAFALELLLQFGRWIYEHRGCYRVILGKRARDAIRSILGEQAHQLRLDIFAVIDARRQYVITVGYLTQRVEAA